MSACTQLCTKQGRAFIVRNDFKHAKTLHVVLLKGNIVENTVARDEDSFLEEKGARSQKAFQVFWRFLTSLLIDQA